VHISSEPAILYFGTPVVLISTTNEDGSSNLAPMSSAFWLGWRCMLGLAMASKTTENLLSTRECVLNLPSDSLASAVNKLARTTGSNPVPAGKARRGYVYEPDKFGISGLTSMASQTVAPLRVVECPVQLEAVLVGQHNLADDDEKLRGGVGVFEVRVQRTHIETSLLMEGETNRIDPDKWRPLIMSFQKYYGLAPNQLHESTLAQIPEAMYRSPDVDRARAAAVNACAAAR
jgi:flavin reductase (DIM6/NTAB) family NADH-FMN oxidoreductase RutF